MKILYTAPLTNRRSVKHIYREITSPAESVESPDVESMRNEVMQQTSGEFEALRQENQLVEVNPKSNDPLEKHAGVSISVENQKQTRILFKDMGVNPPTREELDDIAYLWNTEYDVEAGKPVPDPAITPQKLYEQVMTKRAFKGIPYTFPHEYQSVGNKDGYKYSDEITSF